MPDDDVQQSDAAVTDSGDDAPDLLNDPATLADLDDAAPGDADDASDPVAAAVQAALAQAIPTLTAQVESALGDRFDAVADRRINKLMSTQEKRQQRDSEGADDRPAERPAGDLDERLWMRAARLSYRDSLADDDWRFAAGWERDLASDLSELALLRARADGLDDDRAGIDAARLVRDRIRSLRSGYEGLTRRALQRKGLLGEATSDEPATAATGGAAPRKRSGPRDPRSEFASGAKLAQEHTTAV